MLNCDFFRERGIIYYYSDKEHSCKTGDYFFLEKCEKKDNKQKLYIDCIVYEKNATIFLTKQNLHMLFTIDEKNCNKQNVTIYANHDDFAKLKKKINVQFVEMENTKKTFCSKKNIKDYKSLFNKYLLNLTDKDNNVNYEIKTEITIIKKNICHIHCFDLDFFDEYFGDCIRNIFLFYDIIVTYCTGEIKYNNMIYINVKNKGYDIGGKIIAINYIKENNINYEYILFLHSKSDKKYRKKMVDSLVKNENRIHLISLLMQINKNLYGIFPDWISSDFKYNSEYLSDVLNYFDCETICKFFCAGNCMILRKEVVQYIFYDNIKMFYNLLNDEESFDVNWVKIYYKYDDLTNDEIYLKFKNEKLHGNNIKIHHTKEQFLDGMIEHVFERIWINIIKHIGGDFLIVNEKNIIDEFNIKTNAIFFPQYHKIKENDDFWGENFTEWTLLKPHDSEILINNKKIKILKPHHDIGYYNLDMKNDFLKQIELAKKYKIDGFIVYHYWFSKDKILMQKILNYFLNEDVDFDFCISWVNEPWTKKWDGKNDEVLLEQKYGDYYEHIHFLMRFFKNKKYIKNEKNECIIYIYNITDIPDLDIMMKIWIEETEKKNIKIKVVSTENSFAKNHNFYNYDSFLFEPMYSGNYIEFQCEEKCNIYDYENVIKNYMNCIYKTDNKHFGLPLNWCNAVRRKNSKFHYFDNVNYENIKKMLLILISIIVMRYVNKFDSSNEKKENIININAWNEWNEQAVLEPNDTNGYEILELIYSIKKDL